MPTKIDTITPEQEARFGEWSDMWIKIGLSCEPADFETAKNAALRAYDICNLERPKIVLFESSPYSTVKAAVAAWIKLNKITKLTEKEKKNLYVEALNNYRGGSFWASWGAYVSFLRDVLDWENPTLENFKIDEDLIKSCGWVWWHEDILVITDRPKEINRDEQNRLHSLTGPSISYRDGWALWHVHGIPVEKYIIENPEEITVKKIEKEDNLELRRIMIDRYKFGQEISGSAAYIIDAGGKKLDHDERFGTLWIREVANDEAIVMIEVINSTREPDGTFKKYWLRVPPTVRTAHEAVAWTFGTTTKEYMPLMET
jgi:hypothetical protein